MIDVGLSLMIEDDFQVASAPLFSDGLVDVVEWSFDMGWGRPLPHWLTSLLSDYSSRDKLLGHGVSYSALDASESERQDIWLNRLAREVAEWNYSHISEHFGFMGGGNFHLAASMPVPRTDTAVQVGRQRLSALAEVAKCPIGLENLAFAFGQRDVLEQGPFLEDLLAPNDGFLLLDLHNLYCQACNFGTSILDLLNAYPLNRVRELHVSGGSWSEHPPESGNRVRRDTHDDLVPDAIFAAIPDVLRKCPNVQYIIMERIGGTIDIDCREDMEGFRNDFRRLKQIVRDAKA